MKILDSSSEESDSKPHRGSQVFKEGCSAVSGNHALLNCHLSSTQTVLVLCLLGDVEPFG